MSNPFYLWDDFWFSPASTFRLDLIRAGMGFWLLLTYGTMSPDLLLLYGNDGILPLEQMQDYIEDPWLHSIYFHFDAHWQFWLAHGIFLAACLGLMLGTLANVCKFIVLVGHLSYVHRNPGLIYGVDGITASILFALCLAPLGRHLALSKRKTLPAPSAWGNACLRIIQLQMAVLFFYSGVEKLRGETWWSGDALWIALNNFEFNNLPVDLLAQHYWLVNLLVYATLLLELAYPFLIWGRGTRPLFLAVAIALHLGIAVLMGLYFFSGVMILGHLAFLRDEWLRQSPAKSPDTDAENRRAPSIGSGLAD